MQAMDEMKNIPKAGTKKRVIIIGGGFGGLKLADKLNPKYFDVVLLDKNNYHQFQPLLYQVAIAGLEVSSIAYPFRKNYQQKKHIHFRMCEVTRIIPAEDGDTSQGLVDTTIGYLAYDYLVIASGCDTNFFGNEELRQSAITLKSASEALFARNRILASFEEAITLDDPVKLNELLHFVIVGGGATGVELAGALADMKRYVLPKDYPELDLSLMEIHLIDASPRLLSGMSEKASENARRTLQERGIILHHSVVVTSYKDNWIEMNDGARLYSGNVFWVAGIAPTPIPGLDSSLYGRGGRLKVNEYCLVNGYKSLYAIGDVALMPAPGYPGGHPQVAQGAIQMAILVAKNLERKQKGKTCQRFQYVDKGSLATIGRNAAVADLGKLKFGGRLAWWLWLFIHIATMIGVKNKILILLDWAWNYVTYDLSLRLLIRPKQSKSD